MRKCGQIVLLRLPRMLTDIVCECLKKLIEGNMDKLYVTITIDTENPQIPYVAGTCRTDTLLNSDKEKNYGIKYILSVFREYGIRATWYLNIYEKYLMGEKLMADVCDILLRNGQDIQLHTHPVWLMDSSERKRIHMNQYSLDEQVYIIEKGIEDIQKLTGQKPIAHRGGAYGIDKNTLLALNMAKMKIDSSVFYKSSSCKVSGIYKNKIHELYGVTEFPVSVYKVKTNYAIPYKSASERIQKSDINYSTADEIKSVCEQNIAGHHIYTNIFMHSFSFYKFFDDGVRPEAPLFAPDKNNIRKFHHVMEYLRTNQKIEIVTVSQLYKKLQNMKIPSKDYMPKVEKTKII